MAWPTLENARAGSSRSVLPALSRAGWGEARGPQGLARAGGLVAQSPAAAGHPLHSDFSRVNGGHSTCSRGTEGTQPRELPGAQQAGSWLHLDQLRLSRRVEEDP